MGKKFIHILPNFVIPEHLSPALLTEKGAVLLESALVTPESRYTILAFEPQKTLESSEDLWKELDSIWTQTPDPELSDLPFEEGWIGFLSYELNSTIIPDITPKFWLGYYDSFYLYDHLDKKAVYVSPREISSSELLTKLYQPNAARKESGTSTPSVISNFTPDRYFQAIDKIKNYLEAGDCYQVNLAQRFQADFNGDASQLYRTLCHKSPAPYAAFLNLGDVQILSSSPECFLNINGQSVITQPIKGTRRRSQNIAEDNDLKIELQNSPKDKAELLMITDLERNDLGKICEPGSIEVSALSQIKAFAQVYHQVATIRGKLRPNISFSDVMKAMFPGGSITGAPKKRAMEIIQELEPHPRNVYCGAIGFVSRGQKAQWNIAIRTLMLKDQKATFYGGGGIVIDSDAKQEYEETLIKIRGILSALNGASG